MRNYHSYIFQTLPELTPFQHVVVNVGEHLTLLSTLISLDVSDTRSTAQIIMLQSDITFSQPLEIQAAFCTGSMRAAR